MREPRENLSRHVVRVLAPNPGPMTLEGTNTWVLRAGRRAVVVDPGPDLPTHLDELLDLVGPLDDVRVLLTHAHPDHRELVPRFLRETGAQPLRLGDGEPLELGPLTLRAVPTPGHTADSVSYWVREPGEPDALLAGDTVLGRGSTVVAHPDGSLGDYLTSLRRLQQDVAGREGARILPGHGPVVDDAAGVLQDYLDHRAERLDQVRRAMADGARTPADIVRRVYAGVDPGLWPAAERSVAAQVEYLRRDTGLSGPGGPTAPDPSPGRPGPPA